jgi:hypothetical protein
VNVTFQYRALGGKTLTTLKLSLGTRNSPLGPMAFSHTGVAQASQPIRSEAQVFYGRGAASTTETFVAQKEHANYWAGVVWSRVELSKARGKQGNLIFEGDGGGRITLRDCVMTEATASPGLVGTVSLIRFTFVGGTWENG